MPEAYHATRQACLAVFRFELHNIGFFLLCIFFLINQGIADTSFHDIMGTYFFTQIPFLCRILLNFSLRTW